MLNKKATLIINQLSLVTFASENLVRFQSGNTGKLFSEYPDYVSGAISGSFQYDTNGNLVQDGTKNGTALIGYNYLNLPASISGSISASFVYDAEGNKLSSTQGGIARDYVDGIQYENGSISSILTSEGRAVRNQSNGIYRYEYNLSDHQGNVRVSLDDQGNNVARVIQEDEYSAFGLRKPGGYLFGDKNNYLYNGKEFQEALGEYDYGARLYDPVLARWNSSDPLADKFSHVSPYNYVYNNPVNFNDPTGMATEGWILSADKLSIDFDPNVHSQGQVTNGGTYLGEHGYSINGETGNTIFHRGDGSEISGVQQLSDVNVTAKGPGIGARVLDAAIGFTPVIGSIRDIYQGARDGNYLQLALGVGGLALDVSSLGTSSLVKGGLKTLGKELLEEGAEAGLKEAASGGFKSFSSFKRTYGSAGTSNAWHHIVEQGGNNVSRFGAESIHNVDNLIKLPHGANSIHAKVSGFYSSKQAFTGGKTVRQWLSTQSFQEQYDFGINTLKQFGWTP